FSCGLQALQFPCHDPLLSGLENTVQHMPLKKLLNSVRSKAGLTKGWKAPSFRTSAAPAARRSGNQRYFAPKARLRVLTLVWSYQQECSLRLTQMSGFQISARHRLTCLE
ncbi:MAG: hypothetical protein AAFY05_27910, partial [Pseudomonadota bacterium]